MRILLVAHGYPPEGLGGTEVYVRQLALALAKERRDQVAVLAREAAFDRPEFSVRREEREGISVYLLNHTYRASTGFADTYRSEAVGEAAARVLDEVRPEVAHVHHLTGLSTALVGELRARGVPVLFTLHDYWLFCQRGQLLDLELRRCAGPTASGCATCAGSAAFTPRPVVGWARQRLPAKAMTALSGGWRRLPVRPSGAAAMEARRQSALELCGEVDRFLAPSRAIAEAFEGFGVPPERILLHPLGVDAARFSQVERAPASSTLRLGFLGTLMVSKAPHLLLEAFARLPPGSATVQLFGEISAYHGDDRYRGQLAPLLALPGVKAHGAIDLSAVPRALSTLDALVLPSIWAENSPLVIREAFLAGLPVVAADVGGVRELVRHEVDGLLVPPGNVEELEKALRRLIEDPGLLPRLRRGLRTPVSIEDDAARTRALYALERSRQSGGAGQGGLAAVVLNYRSFASTLAAVRSLQRSTRPPDLIVVVDNGSGDGSSEFLRTRLPECRHVSLEQNLGFSGGSNAGLREALARGAGRVLLCNSDARVEPDCLALLERALLENEQAGIVGPLLLRPSGQVESAGLALSPRTGRMRSLGRDGQARPPGPFQVTAVSGCVMLINRQVLRQVGLLDEAYFFSFEDLDLCLRAQQRGFQTLCVPAAVARHEGSLSIGRRSERRLYFATRNHLRLAREVAPLPGAAGVLRAASITSLNLAHALLTAEAPGLPAVAAALRGWRDHLRRRYHQSG